jgi:nitric oxide reductase NorE protein
MAYRLDTNRSPRGPAGRAPSTADELPGALPRHVPGEAGVWVVILGELTLFAALFSAYLWAQGRAPGEFEASQTHLHQGRALFNTLLLLTGSLCVALGVQAARDGRLPFARRLLLAASASGVTFGLVKVVEYRDLLAEGFTPATNDFFMYYFVLTGLHLLHLVIGIGVLTFLASLVGRANFSGRRLGYLEGGGCFWHMVDIVWIVLFPLLYLVR